MFYKRKRHLMPLRHRLKKFIGTSLKAVVFAMIPCILAVPITYFWYQAFFLEGRHFKDNLEATVTAAWIPTFGILYSLLAAVFITTVWSEYKAAKVAVKRYDVDKFMEVRDESLSPLVHVTMGIMAIFLLGAFMGLSYPTLVSGLLIIFSTAYVFSFLFCLVIELDDPSGGFWYIAEIPQDWLELEAEAWWEDRCKKSKERFMRRHGLRCRTRKQAKVA